MVTEARKQYSKQTEAQKKIYIKINDILTMISEIQKDQRVLKI
jgi:hypothetical protein